MHLDADEKLKLFHYSTYFYYYPWVSLHFLVLFMGSTVLFQLTFTFIYNTFSNNFSISAKEVVSKHTLSLNYYISLEFVVFFFFFFFGKENALKLE